MNSAQSIAFLLILIDVIVFVVLLPSSLWLAFKSTARLRFWRVIAAMTWGGMALAVIGKTSYPAVQVLGATVLQLAILVVGGGLLWKLIRSIWARARASVRQNETA
jgi:hypothetical protein